MMISSLKIELLSIICRRVLLSDADLQNHELHKSVKFHNKEEVHDHWNKLSSNVKESYGTSFGFTFQAVLNHPDICNETLEDGHWLPLGVAQMKKWLPSILMWLFNLHAILGIKISDICSRNNDICKYMKEEHCGFCSAPVPFESPEVAWCEGVVDHNGVKDRHKLLRCAVSMRLCSVEKPMWFCMCCRRYVADLPPSLILSIVRLSN
ncbi:hypothetical protein HPP92_020922 [Vanilla planifolia]|uniref:Uncharacterized protein n=1 Tax=Vanilla planifolia TaxID=51239 RepID=A0A835UK83_VANPL|nr:hypothetical protein HPP92_020922 [Vanilla planifolia]